MTLRRKDYSCFNLLQLKQTISIFKLNQMVPGSTAYQVCEVTVLSRHLLFYFHTTSPNYHKGNHTPFHLSIIQLHAFICKLSKALRDVECSLYAKALLPQTHHIQRGSECRFSVWETTVNSSSTGNKICTLNCLLHSGFPQAIYYCPL